MSRRLTYEQVRCTFVDKQCELLTTESEYNDCKMNSKSYYHIKSSCGHETSTKYDMFLAKNTGLHCKACTKQNIKEKLKHLSQDANKLEYTGFCFIRQLLESDFQVEKMCEGTKADFAIKPKHVDIDLWLPVQLKTTRGPKEEYSGNYSFSVRNDYIGMALILLSIKDKNMWLMEGSQAPSTMVTIGKSSKYNRFMIQNNAHQQFAELYDALVKHPLSNLNIPTGKAHQREQEYRKIREGKISYLHFEYPECENLKYDFVINGFTTQEKVMSYFRKRGKLQNNCYVVSLGGGIDVRGIVRSTYKLGDADYYWLNVPDSDVFYIIPEGVLHASGLIEPKSTKHLMLMLYTNRDDRWYSNYQYNYETTPPEVIQGLFQAMNFEGTAN